MSIIANSLFTGVADRVAKQAEIQSTAFTQSQAQGTGKFYPRIHDGVGVGGNYDVENAMIRSANSLDNDTFSGVPTANFWASAYSDFMSALETHTQSEGATDLDDFLNTSGINVDPYFERVYFVCKGSHLDARNVFMDTPVELGVVDVISSGVGTFTEEAVIGTGTGKVDDTNHAAAQLHAIPQATISSDLVLDMSVFAEDVADGRVLTSRNVTIPGGTAGGTLVSIGTSGVDKFLEVDSVLIAGGTTSDQVKIVSQVERIRAL